MREIKFRAWLPKTKKMVYFSEPHINYEYGLFALRCDSPKEYQGITNMPDDCDEAIFMQFTGLYDKNGKEIYEGDVCQIDDDKTYIEFSDGAFWFMYNKNDGFTYDWAKANNQWGEVEIIGNVWENPELLK